MTIELVIDNRVMDTFVIRVVGNVDDADEVGSVEKGLAGIAEMEGLVDELKILELPDSKTTQKTD